MVSIDINERLQKQAEYCLMIVKHSIYSLQEQQRALEKILKETEEEMNAVNTEGH